MCIKRGEGGGGREKKKKKKKGKKGRAGSVRRANRRRAGNRGRKPQNRKHPPRPPDNHIITFCGPVIPTPRFDPSFVIDVALCRCTALKSPRPPPAIHTRLVVFLIARKTNRTKPLFFNQTLLIKPLFVPSLSRRYACLFFFFFLSFFPLPDQLSRLMLQSCYFSLKNSSSWRKK